MTVAIARSAKTCHAQSSGALVFGRKSNRPHQHYHGWTRTLSYGAEPEKLRSGVHIKLGDDARWGPAHALARFFIVKHLRNGTQIQSDRLCFCYESPAVRELLVRDTG